MLIARCTRQLLLTVDMAVRVSAWNGGGSGRPKVKAA